MKKRPPVQLALVAVPGSGDGRVPTRLVAARSRRPALAPKPWACVVLGVDTAARSGWCIAVSGKRVDSGELDTLDTPELERVVRWAIDLGRLGGLRVVLVLEAPWGGSVAVVAALGVARERWERAWRDAGQTVRRVVRVNPSSWRAAVLGRGAIGLERQAVRALEQTVARRLVGRELGADESAAVLIARWGAQAGAVGKAIGKRAQRRSLREWTSNS
jgi:hypothetical protein